MSGQIVGLDKLIAKLNTLGGNSQAALKKGIIKATLKVQGDAKDLTPVDTGQLRNSIQTEVKEKQDKIEGKVLTNSDHAAYVEFGTGQKGDSSPSPPKYDGSLNYRHDWSGMPAQPFLYPALKQNEEKVKELIKTELKEEIRKVARR